jgi:hypothetical protein
MDKSLVKSKKVIFEYLSLTSMEKKSPAFVAEYPASVYSNHVNCEKIEDDHQFLN